MTHVIYNKTTTRLLNRNCYKTVPAAKAGLTRAAKKDTTMIVADYAVIDVIDYYENIAKTVTRVNLLSGEEYQEDINTPLSCSPASETYWCN